jgi:hemerythrin-like domain-containing protein
MAAVTQPLRDEHHELFPMVDRLRVAAEAAGQVRSDELATLVDLALDFLSHQLIPHAKAEEEVLYPVVARLMGAPTATATMSRDHTEVVSLASDLASLRKRLTHAHLDEDQVQALQKLMYGLHAIIKLHFAKEEEVYLPLLDARLSASEARTMFEAMEAAAGRAKASSLPRRA